LRAGVPAVEAGPVSAAGVGSFRWERRLITVLGVLLVGPEEAAPFELAPALERLVGKLRSFGARIQEPAPDRIVAAFGYEPGADAPGWPCSRPWGGWKAASASICPGGSRSMSADA